MAFSITSSFDSDFYLSQNPDVAAAIEAGLFESAEQHFNQFGFSEGRDPNPYFDTSFYLEQNPDVASAGINPLNHFNQFGETEGRSPNAIFNPTYYLEQNPDVAASGISPFLHFINHGAGEGRSPNASVASQTSEGFDEAAYLAANPDIADAIANGTFSSGYEHWLLFGFDEERSGAQNTGGDPIDQPNNSGTPSGNPDDSPADPDVPGAGGGGGGTPADTTAPTITSSAVFAANENQSNVGTITADETSTFSIVGGADQALFQINQNTGELSFIAAPDFEVPADVGADNTYEVNVVATDAAGNTSTIESVSVDVADLVETNQSIQAAIDAASPGDTILIGAGVFIEDIVLNKDNVTLKTEAGAEIVGTVRLEADNITLDGFTLDGDRLGQDPGNIRGIRIADGDNITISNMNVSDFTTGASLDFGGSPTNVTFTGNTFTGNIAGIGSTENVTGLVINGNTFDDNDEGIGLGIGAVLAAPADTIDALASANTFQNIDGTEYAIGDYRTGTPTKYDSNGNIVVFAGESIQDAIDAAEAGETILVQAGDYVENLVIDKGLTIQALNGGDVNLVPASGVGITFAQNVDGDVTLDGLDLVGNGTSTTTGIDVTPGANLGILTFTNGEINGFTDRGIFSTDDADPTNLLAMGALVVSNSTLSDNGNGGGNTAHIKLFGFNGNATFENISLVGEPGGSAIGSRPDNAIELIGGLNAPNSANPAPANSPDIGTVTFNGVTISGEYHKNPIGIFNFGELDGLSITGLDLSGAVASWKLFNIDGVTESNIDGSSYGITFPNTTDVVAEFQGEKLADQGAVDTTITGTSSGDQLNGKEGNDTLNGGDGNDILIGGDGDNQLNGGDGIDAAIFIGNFQDYTTELLANGEFRVEDANGVNTLTNVENLVFADAVYNLELEALTRYDQDVTPEIIFGSGNINGNFTTSTVDNTEHSLELGIRGKLRFNDSNQPENTFNSNGDGTYTFETGSPTGGESWVDANTPVWSFEFTVNTDVDGGSGKALNDYTFLLEMDGDSSSATDFGDSFDPIIVTLADHAIGNNATGNGDGVSAADEVDYANLIDTNNVAQQSWTYEFFDDALSQLATFDPTDEGIYTIKLSAFDEGDLVNVVSINIVTEAPEVT